MDLTTPEAQKVIRAAYADAKQQRKLNEDDRVALSVDEIAERTKLPKNFVDAVLGEVFSND